MKLIGTLVSFPLLFALAGCGARDTEIDGIPGPGARTTTPPAILNHTLEPAENTRAGINSAGRPAGSAGGNPGAPDVVGTAPETSTEAGKTAGKTPPPR